MKIELTRELLEKMLIEDNLSTNKIGKLLKYSSPTIRRYMKKWELISNYKSIKTKKTTINTTDKKCANCLEFKNLNNFNKKNENTYQSYCKKCQNERRYNIFKNNKLILLEEFGNKCSKCGYNKNTAALEFHHIDPLKKDFNLGKARSINISKLRQELEKCILICANCHRELHYPQCNLII